jgi:hypothetical protein
MRISQPTMPPQLAFANSGATSVPDWLASMGLQYLTDAFIMEGFDDLKYIPDLERKDLEQIGVEDET